MTVTAVVGAQWGDEGKGRVVDWLAQRADMVVLDQNLFELEKAKRLDRLGETRVLMTILDGQVVYDALAKTAGN